MWVFIFIVKVMPLLGSSCTQHFGPPVSKHLIPSVLMVFQGIWYQLLDETNEWLLQWTKKFIEPKPLRESGVFKASINHILLMTTVRKFYLWIWESASRYLRNESHLDSQPKGDKAAVSVWILKPVLGSSVPCCFCSSSSFCWNAHLVPIISSPRIHLVTKSLQIDPQMETENNT